MDVVEVKTGFLHKAGYALNINGVTGWSVTPCTGYSANDIIGKEVSTNEKCKNIAVCRTVYLSSTFKCTHLRFYNYAVCKTYCINEV